MNARVFFLVLFSFFFMTVWNADQKAAQRALAKKAAFVRRVPQLAFRTADSRQDSSSPLLLSEGAASNEPSAEAEISEASIAGEIEEGIDVEIEVPVPSPPAPAEVVPAETAAAEVPAVESLVTDAGVLETMPFDVNSTLLMVTSVPFLATVVEYGASEAEAVSGDSTNAPSASIEQSPEVQTMDAALLLVDAAPAEAPEDLRIESAVPETTSTEALAGENQVQPESAQTAETSASATESVGDQAEDSESPGSESQNSESQISDEGVLPVPQLADVSSRVQSGSSSENSGSDQSSELPLETVSSTIPLPKNLASGTWQVMGKSGEFLRITIHRPMVETKLGAEPEKLEESFCIATAPDGERWCFVRSFTDSAEQTGRVSTRFFAPVAKP